MFKNKSGHESGYKTGAFDEKNSKVMKISCKCTFKNTFA
jgi:hypothetical protein